MRSSTDQITITCESGFSVPAGPFAELMSIENVDGYRLRSI